MLVGMAVGTLVGVAAIFYFTIQDALDRFAVFASVLMLFQLLGSTIGATIGKPHDDIQ